MGKPKEIDGELVEKLAAIHCTMQEMAAIVDCDVKTLRTRCSQEIEKGRLKGKQVLRRGLWDLARKGNLGALIWLSKQHLGMSDNGLIPEAPKPLKLTAEISLDELHQQALLVLAREIAHLLNRSTDRKLANDEAVLLSNNIKLINELKELKAIDDLTTKVKETK